MSRTPRPKRRSAAISYDTHDLLVVTARAVSNNGKDGHLSVDRLLRGALMLLNNGQRQDIYARIAELSSATDAEVATMVRDITNRP